MTGMSENAFVIICHGMAPKYPFLPRVVKLPDTAQHGYRGLLVSNRVIDQVQFTEAEFENFFHYYRGYRHQREAVELLRQAINKADPCLLTKTQDWVECYRDVYEPEPEYSCLVDKVQLAEIWGCAVNQITDSEIEDLNLCLHEFAIITPERIRHFLAQGSHETGCGRWLIELDPGDYLEGREDLGNTSPGDGKLYRGAGFLQLTGKFNYEILARRMNDERVMIGGAEYVSGVYPFSSAGIWWEQNLMNAFIDNGATCKEVTRRVNGGYNGLDHRQELYEICRRVIQ